MICKNCNTEFDGMFCPMCGTKCDAGQNVSTESPAQTSPGVYDFSDSKTKDTGKVNADPAVQNQSVSNTFTQNGATQSAPGVYTFQNADQSGNIGNPDISQNQKKPIYKRSILYILIGIIVFLIIVISGISCACNSCAQKSSTRSSGISKSYDAWPSFGLAKMLPAPDSDKIEVHSNDSDYFSCDVESIDEKAFDAYVSACIEKGFDKNYSSFSGSYNAENKDGYALSLYLFTSSDEMDITLTAPKKETTKPTQKPTVKETQKPTVKETQKPTEAKKETEKEDSGTVTPSFKELMDEYERFMDDYIAFMKDYENSDDVMGMLNDYSTWLSDYTDWVKKIDDIDEDELSIADLNYYLEVTNRVTEKLLEIE